LFIAFLVILYALQDESKTINMKNTLTLLIILFSLTYCSPILAQNCQGGIAQYSFNENNINVRLNTTGNIWWDGSGESGYEFPSGSGKHLLFSGGLWMGGQDAGGNLRLAAQTYGSSAGEFDFYPGPIDPVTGSTTDIDCANWDQFFTANQSDIQTFLLDFNDNGQIDDPIPLSIRSWPAQGNPFFEDLQNFSLPNKILAPFVDQDGDGNYEPSQGDYPKIKGTHAVWWVYNDIGNVHSQSGGIPLGMEVQAMAYAYAGGNDLIEDATFYDFKIIYYGDESLNDYYTSFWVDPDIGCSNDDYIGCHPTSNLAYAYNGSAFDQSCGGTNGYGPDIPMVGIKILKNTITDDGMMSGFSYYLNGGGSPTPPPGTTDPQQLLEFYRLMQSLWLDGAPFTQGGNGRNGNAAYPFAFDNSLINGTPWTECSAFRPSGDRRFLMNFGPITLLPGQIQELNFVVITKTDAIYPCPEVGGLIVDADFVATFDSTTLINDPNTPSPPLAAFSYDQEAEGAVSFSDASSFSPDQWIWVFGDGNTGTDQFPTHIYAAEGTYTVCLTVSNSFGGDTHCQDIDVIVQSAPVADFEFDNPFGSAVLFQDMSTNDPITHFWDLGNGETDTRSTFIQFYDNLDVYEVCLTVTNSVGEDTVCKEVDLLSTSTEELTSLSYIAYPNPTEEYLYLDFSEPISPKLEIRFFDVLGKVATPIFQKNGSQLEISVVNLPKGLYFFELIEDGKNSGNGKFVVD